MTRRLEGYINIMGKETLSAKKQLNLILDIHRETLQDLWYLQIG
jgi:hypothetical protein